MCNTFCVCCRNDCGSGTVGGTVGFCVLPFKRASTLKRRCIATTTRSIIPQQTKRPRTVFNLVADAPSIVKLLQKPCYTTDGKRKQVTVTYSIVQHVPHNFFLVAHLNSHHYRPQSCSLSASSCISGPTPTSSIRAGARIGRTCNTTPATKYKTRSDGLSADGGTSVSPESASSGGASGGQSCEGNSTGMSSAEPYSLTISGDEDDNDSWMRGKRHSRDIGLNETGVRGLGRKAPGDKGRSPSGTGGFLGGAAAGDGLSEETSSSSSATLSLQLPFSEDEAAVLSGLGHTFHLARAGSGVTGGGGGGLSGNGNNAALLAGQGQRSVFFDRLPAEAVRVRMLDLNEELTHLDRCRRTLEVKLRQERAE